MRKVRQFKCPLRFENQCYTLHKKAFPFCVSFKIMLYDAIIRLRVGYTMSTI